MGASRTVARHVVVHGIVQGVGFRYAARREAERTGVSGWVRNRTDGAVETAFSGSADAVEAMLAWLRHGPSSATVTRVEVDDAEAELGPGFEVQA